MRNVLRYSWISGTRNHQTWTLHIFGGLVELRGASLWNDYGYECVGLGSSLTKFLGMSPFSGDNEDILYHSILHDKVQYPSKIDRESKTFCEKVNMFFICILILINCQLFLDFGDLEMTLWKFIFYGRFLRKRKYNWKM